MPATIGIAVGFRVELDNTALAGGELCTTPLNTSCLLGTCLEHLLGFSLTHDHSLSNSLGLPNTIFVGHVLCVPHHTSGVATPLSIQHSTASCLAHERLHPVSPTPDAFSARPSGRASHTLGPACRQPPRALPHRLPFYCCEASWRAVRYFALTGSEEVFSWG